MVLIVVIYANGVFNSSTKGSSSGGTSLGEFALFECVSTERVRTVTLVCVHTLVGLIVFTLSCVEPWDPAGEFMGSTSTFPL
jgi:hypothetical protein